MLGPNGLRVLGCGTSPPPDCGCARTIELDLSGLVASTDTINLNADASRTATLPTMEDVSSLLLTFTPGTCYLLSLANAVSDGPATVDDASTFDLYLLVWWADGFMYIAVLEIQSGATWDRLVILFYGSEELYTLEDCCRFFETADRQNLFINNLDGGVNDSMTLTFPDALVTAGLFPTNDVEFVIGSDNSGTAMVQIRCCPPCFYSGTSQPSASITVTGPCSGSYPDPVPYQSGFDGSDGLPCIMTWGPPGSTVLKVFWDKEAETYGAVILAGATELFSADDIDLEFVDCVLTGTFEMTGEAGCSGSTAMVVLG